MKLIANVTQGRLALSFPLTCLQYVRVRLGGDERIAFSTEQQPLNIVFSGLKTNHLMKTH